MIGRRYIFPLLVLVTFLANSMPGWWDWGYMCDTRRWYYIMQAICWFPIVFSIGFYDKKDKFHKRSLVIFLWCLVNNLMDELFFDPVHIGINELIFAVFIIIWTLATWMLAHKKNG